MYTTKKLSYRYGFYMYTPINCHIGMHRLDKLNMNSIFCKKISEQTTHRNLVLPLNHEYNEINQSDLTNIIFIILTKYCEKMKF